MTGARQEMNPSDSGALSSGLSRCQTSHHSRSMLQSNGGCGKEFRKRLEVGKKKKKIRVFAGAKGAKGRGRSCSDQR